MIAFDGSIARHLKRIDAIRLFSGVVGAPVADVDPELVGGRQVLERALGEGLEGAGAPGVGPPAGQGLGVEVDLSCERDPVPRGEPHARRRSRDRSTSSLTLVTM